MRLAVPPAVVVLAAAAVVAQPDRPTAAETTAMNALRALKGFPQIDADLHPEARVSVKFAAASDATLAAVAKHPQVGSVQATDGTAVTAKGFVALHKLPYLRRLTLNRSGVTDKELAEIAGCGQLRALIIPEAGVTDGGVAVLEKLTRLEMLDLSENPKLTDKAAGTLKTLVRLEALYLTKTGFTDKGLAELRPLEALRNLNLAGTKVTSKAADEFVDAMPNLRVIRR